MRRRSLVPLAVAGMLALAGCGGSTATPPGNQPATALSTWASTPAARSTQPPAAVPERLRFSGSTVDGRSFSGEALAGRPAVLWFWAPWCTICRGEAPDIDAMQRRFGDRVRFVGVAGLGELGDMKRFVSDTGLGAFPHVVDEDGSLWSRFGVQAQPAFAFVGRDGKVDVVAGRLSAEDLAGRLDRLSRG